MDDDGELTESQRDLLERVAGFWTTHGLGPTIRDVCTMMGWRSTNAAHEKLSRLRRKGMVIMATGRQVRQVRLTERGRELLAADARAIPIYSLKNLPRDL